MSECKWGAGMGSNGKKILLLTMVLSFAACGEVEPETPTGRRAARDAIQGEQTTPTSGATQKSSSKNQAGDTSKTNPDTTDAQAQTPSGDGDCLEADALTCAVEEEIIKQTNAFRLQNGVTKPLQRFGGKMSWLARYWSKVQGDRTGLGHDGWRSGLYAQVYPKKFNEPLPTILGENSVTQDGQDDPAYIASLMVGWWAKSPGHRANMLGNYNYIAVGAYKKGPSIFGTGNNWWGTQIFH